MIHHKGNKTPSSQYYLLCLCLFVVFFSSNLFAETLETLDQKIGLANLRIVEITKTYDKEKKLNETRIQKAETIRAGNQAEADRILQQAYAAAEKLGTINASLNQWELQKDELCRQWRALYGTTVDELLAAAEQERDKRKKGEIGRTLQRYQTRNLQLCAEGIETAVSQEWRSLRIETYDGPQEIQQKIQLLQDISREININITRLDQQYQDALREQKTKERAQEFIQESTLFTESVIVRPGTGSSAGPVSSSAVELVGPSSPTGEGGSPQAIATSDPFNKEYGDEFKAQYQKTKKDLNAQEKELQKRIAEFRQTARALQLP